MSARVAATRIGTCPCSGSRPASPAFSSTTNGRAGFRHLTGVDLGLLVPTVLKATAQTLKEFPELNARLEGDAIVYLERYDLGLAVQTDQGLVVPVVRGCDTASIEELAAEVARLAEGARARTLKPEELRGSTFSVTSAGRLGGILTTPIVNWAIPFSRDALIAVAVATLVPIGVALGVPMPAGLRLLSARAPQMVTWAWGMNGALSVVGATLAIFIAMNWGFGTTLVTASGMYLFGLIALLVASN